MEVSNSINKTRYYWIDNIKFAACALVVLGHFYMSMVQSKILPDNSVYNFLIQTVYTFHVPLFFICSGFLYQKSNKVHSLKSWSHNIADKLLNLGVPYFTFSIITFLFKTIFSDYVNTQEGNLLNSLFINPISPYWYLYVLFFLFLLVPCVDSKKQANILLAVAVAAKIITIVVYDSHFKMPYIFSLASRFIWFAIGIWLAVYEIEFKTNKNKIIMAVSFITAVSISIVFYQEYNSLESIKTVIGILFITAIVILSQTIDNKFINKLSFKFSEYFMPVYLTHTIFSAGIRSILFKLGITNTVAHIIFGVIAGFIFPVLVYMIAKRIPILQFFFYPKKAIKRKKQPRITSYE